MAKGPNTALRRLREDAKVLSGLLAVAVLTALLVSLSWPRPASDPYAVTNSEGSSVVALFCALAGGLPLLGGLWAIWARCRPGGPHWQDRWQARQGEVVDLVLSGVTFPAKALNGLRGGELARGGFGVAQNAAGIANVPVVGGLGGPLVLVGVAVMAIGAVVGIGQASAQERRDEVVTRVFRGAARKQLTEHLAGLQSRRFAVRGRRLSRLDLDMLRTREAIAEIERRGFTVPTQ